MAFIFMIKATKAKKGQIDFHKIWMIYDFTVKVPLKSIEWSSFYGKNKLYSAKNVFLLIIFG